MHIYSTVFLEMYFRLEAIIDITGANTYHGFLPSLVRKCIQYMVEPTSASTTDVGSGGGQSSSTQSAVTTAVTAFPHSFSTALFSFLYHLASYESGGEALLSCGIMPSLLKLANWYSDEQEHITVSVCLLVRGCRLNQRLKVQALYTIFFVVRLTEPKRDVQCWMGYCWAFSWPPWFNLVAGPLD